MPRSSTKLSKTPWMVKQFFLPLLEKTITKWLKHMVDPHKFWVTLNLENLYSRRQRLTLKFALKCEKHTKFKSWFYPTTKDRNTRAKLNKYCDVRANHTRFAKSPLSIITNLLNMHYNKT